MCQLVDCMRRCTKDFPFFELGYSFSLDRRWQTSKREDTTFTVLLVIFSIFRKDRVMRLSCRGNDLYAIVCLVRNDLSIYCVQVSERNSQIGSTEVNTNSFR